MQLIALKVEGTFKSPVESTVLRVPDKVLITMCVSLLNLLRTCEEKVDCLDTV